MLVEAFGIANSLQDIREMLLPYFAACGVEIVDSSSGRCEQRRLDNPRQSLDDPRRRQPDEYLGIPVEDLILHILSFMEYLSNSATWLAQLDKETQTWEKPPLHLFTKHLAGEEANQSIPKCASQEVFFCDVYKL